METLGPINADGANFLSEIRSKYRTILNGKTRDCAPSSVVMRLRLLAALRNWNRKDNDSIEKQTDNMELIKPLTGSLNQ